MLARMLTAPTCATVIPSPSRIRSLVHVLHVKMRIGFSAVTLCPLLNSRRLMSLFLAGRTGCITAQTICLLRRESLLATETFIAFDIVIGPQVPKSSPMRYKRSLLNSSGCHSTLLIFLLIL